MKKLFSARYTAGAINTGLLVLRVGLGILMMTHGYDKLIHFSEKSATFMNWMGIGSTASLALVVFAEFFCSLFLILGMFTRLAAIPIIIDMSVAIALAHGYDFLGEGEKASLFLVGCLTVLICGPGKISVDGAIGK